MTKERQRLKLRPGDRFDPSVTADRLEALRKLAGVEPKDVAGAIWPSQSPENAARTWYKRANQKTQAFSLPEIQAAVDYLLPEANRRGTVTAKVLPGFPFIDLFVSVSVERGDIGRPGPRRV